MVSAPHGTNLTSPSPAISVSAGFFHSIVRRVVPAVILPTCDLTPLPVQTLLPTRAGQRSHQHVQSSHLRRRWSLRLVDIGLCPRFLSAGVHFLRDPSFPVETLPTSSDRSTFKFCWDRSLEVDSTLAGTHTSREIVSISSGTSFFLARSDDGSEEKVVGEGMGQRGEGKRGYGGRSREVTHGAKRTKGRQRRT
eukprot:748338-Hanusia_phi.AAC.2